MIFLVENVIKMRCHLPAIGLVFINAYQAVEGAAILASSIVAFLEGKKPPFQTYDPVHSKRVEELASFSARCA